MYEGLSEELLSRAIPADLGVRVITGFARNERGEISSQLDRMLVVGVGERIPHTNKFFWPAQDVLMVMEVKKNLGPKDMADAIANHRSFRNVEGNALDDLPNIPSWYEHERLVRAVGQITSTHLHTMNWAQYELEARMIGPALFMDQLTALRVVLGFHGHKTEHGFRTALRTVLGEQLTSSTKFMHLPHLVIGGKHSLVKANGRPYYVPRQRGGWDCYFTTPANPLLVLLELIWTRLDDRFNLDDPWGQDLTNEVGRSFMKAVPAVIDKKDTWDLQFVASSAALLNSMPVHEPWEPVEISLEHATALALILSDGPIGKDDPSLAKLASDSGTSDTNLVAQLIATGLVSEGPSGLSIHARRLMMGYLPDGRMVAADDPSGRLMRWLGMRSPLLKAPESDVEPHAQPLESDPTSSS